MRKINSQPVFVLLSAEFGNSDETIGKARVQYKNQVKTGALLIAPN